MPLLDLFWTMLWFFLFFVWIWLLISVFGDIFRSKDLGGGMKAFWVIFVVVLPYVGVLIYLIARGDSMHERQREMVKAQDDATRDYIREAAGAPSKAEELTMLVELRDKGELTSEEFERHKAELLA